MTAVLGIALGLSAFALSDPILSIFIKDNAVAVQYGFDRLKITFPVYFLAGIMGVLPGAIRGLGYSTSPSLIAIFGACGVRIVWIYTIFKMYVQL